MNLPSRGLRLSATTIRNTGAFFAPMRFIRILTAINLLFNRGPLASHSQPQPAVSRKRRAEIRHVLNSLQALFYVKNATAETSPTSSCVWSCLYLWSLSMTEVNIRLEASVSHKILQYVDENWLRCWFLGIDPKCVRLTIPKKLEH